MRHGASIMLRRQGSLVQKNGYIWSQSIAQSVRQIHASETLDIPEEKEFKESVNLSISLNGNTKAIGDQKEEA
jgi:hypothetical protein